MDTSNMRLSELSPEMRELERQSFEIAFETLLEHLTTGRPFDSFCQSYHTPLPSGRFRSWIFANTKRREAYYVAKAIGAEAIEDEMVRIADGFDADGNPSLNDVARNTLQINTRKWLMQVNNRKRYGDVKHIEQTTTTRFDPDELSTQDLTMRILDALGMSDSDLLVIDDHSPVL